MHFQKVRYQWFIILGSVVLVILSFTVFMPEPKPVPIPDEKKQYNQFSYFEKQLLEQNDPTSLFHPDEIKVSSYSFKDGQHLFSGEITFPETCMPSRLRGGYSEEDSSIILTFLTGPAQVYEGCEKNLPLVSQWSSAINAPENVEIKAVFNGVDTPLAMPK